ncbi:MAG: carboxypeptidase regulatory-like domain-containing protein [Acidobacteriota bacterium]|nr:carboxypeptidase regulatory-like domain-containing protein [Acidobacteriota bacterium]
MGWLWRSGACRGASGGSLPRTYVWLPCVLLLAGTQHVAAQSAVDGALAGYATEPSGRMVTGAIVDATSLATGEHTLGLTGRHGEFLLPHLAPGEYLVRITGAPGELLLQAELAAAEVTEVQGVLRPPVPRTPPQAAAVAAQTTLDATKIADLPAGQGNWATLAGVLSGSAQSTDDAGAVSLRALPAVQTATSIDGGSADQSFSAVQLGAGQEAGSEAEADRESGLAGRQGDGGLGGGTERRAGAAYTFAREAVRQARVGTRSYSALYGLGAGGSITAVSRSGGRQVHGSLFYLNRNSALAARNPYAIATTYTDGVVGSGVVQPLDVRQQFGGSVGGPLWRDRLYGFYTLDVLRHNEPAISSPANPLFYQLTATQSALLANRGVSLAQRNTALNYLSSLTGSTPRRQDQTIHFLKLDWRAAATQHLSAEYNRVRMSGPGAGRSGPVVDRGRASLGNSFAQIDSAQARWLWTPGSHWSNELRLMAGHDLQYETAQPSLPQEPGIGPDGQAPEVAIGPYGFSFGTPAALSRAAYPDERRGEVSELLTWTHGRHVLQLGGTASLAVDRIDALSSRYGSFHYDSGFTKGRAGGLVDWITDYTYDAHAYPNGGCPSITAAVHDFCFRTFAQSFGQQVVEFRTQQWAGFVQQSWRLRPGLTLDGGARYEYQLLPLPQQPNGYLDAVFGTVGATSIFPEDRNNLAGRIGLAWQPFGVGGGVVRVGYGQFYGRLPGVTLRSVLVDTALPLSASHVRIVPGTVTNCPQVSSQGFGYGCDYVAQPPAAVQATSSAVVFTRRFRLPMVQQATLSVERQLGGGVVATLRYAGALERQLTNSVDLNLLPSTTMKTFQISGGSGQPGLQDGATFAVPAYSQRVTASYGPLTGLVSNGNGTYHALQVQVTRRARGGLELGVGWTWSKALDYGASEGGVPRTSGQFDPFSVAYDKGVSSLNMPHRLVAQAVWQPVVHTASPLLRALGQGWAVAPVFTESSGRPYSYMIFGGTRLSGGHESINGSGGAQYLPTVGRNTLRLPDRLNLDLRVSRIVPLGDHLRLRGIAEAYNLTNRVNLSSVTTRAFLLGPVTNGVTPLLFQDAAAIASEGLNTLPFGSPTAAATEQLRERQIQLGLRAEF